MEVAQSIAPEGVPVRSILYVITKANWGGAQRYVFELALAARSRGYAVHVACGTQGELTQRLIAESIPVSLVSGLSRDVHFSADLRALASLYRIIRKERPDVVHANSSKAGLIAVVAARLARVPRIIFTAHGWAFNESRPAWQRKIFAVMHWLTALLAHKVICVSEAIRRDARSLPLIEDRLVMLHHGVAPVPTLPRTEARHGLEGHAKRGLLGSAFWVGSLAELHPNKGLDTLVQAFAAVATHAPHAILVLIGAGQDQGRLAALAHQLRIEDRVFFCGHVAQGARYLSALDLFVLPSRSEALGYALLEAGIAGIPSVASKVGGIPEIITDGLNGLLVPAGDSTALSAALRTLIDDAELRTRYGKALQEKVLNEFGEQQMLDQTFALYGD